MGTAAPAPRPLTGAVGMSRVGRSARVRRVKEDLQVELRGVGVRYGALRALEDVDLELRRGEFVTLVGPSGCGKSTLLRVVAGLVPPSSGERRIACRPNQVAFVFQDPTLLPWRTVHANVRLPLELARRPSAEQGAAADAALARVGLAEFAAAHPAELSGGMKMRASLARALVARPELLLLDEPFGALDELGRERLDDELMALWERERWTVLAITHSVAEAVLLSDRVLVCSGRPGRVVAELAITLPRPRRAAQLDAPALAALAGAVRARLREAA